MAGGGQACKGVEFSYVTEAKFLSIYVRSLQLYNVLCNCNSNHKENINRIDRKGNEKAIKIHHYKKPAYGCPFA